jgi:hypothetical protein
LDAGVKNWIGLKRWFNILVGGVTLTVPVRVCSAPEFEQEVRVWRVEPKPEHFASAFHRARDIQNKFPDAAGTN